MSDEARNVEILKQAYTALERHARAAASMTG